MLGGVTVNFILAFFIFIMMLFVWGTNYIEKDDVKYGFGISKTLQAYGFQQGDKIISVDGTDFEDLSISIDKYLMFRTVGNIKVEHPDGSIADIQLPEDIGSKLFEAGDLPALTPRYPYQVDSVIAGSLAENAGIKAGDKMIAINGKPVTFFSDFKYQLKNNTSQTLEVEFERGGLMETISIVPVENKGIGVLTTAADPDYIKFQKREYSLSESFSGGINKGYWEVKDYLSQFKYIFTKKGASQLGGFAAIYNMFPAQWNWQAFWYLTAFLSIMLGVLNLLPIPALDGGHVMFLLYEMVSGRKPSDKFMEYAQTAGFFILIALVLFANGNDVFKAIFD